MTVIQGISQNWKKKKKKVELITPKVAFIAKSWMRLPRMKVEWEEVKGPGPKALQPLVLGKHRGKGTQSGKRTKREGRPREQCFKEEAPIFLSAG